VACKGTNVFATVAALCHTSPIPYLSYFAIKAWIQVASFSI